MSRGFVKEDDLELAGTELPERPISPHPNYVTAVGMAELEAQCEQLSQEHGQLNAQKDDPSVAQRLAALERDLRYYAARLDSAILVDPATQDKNTVLFGAHVKVQDDTGELQTFMIVGEDESYASRYKVSYLSPIAKALIGKKVGDRVQWQRPAGNLTLEIIEISY